MDVCVVVTQRKHGRACPGLEEKQWRRRRCIISHEWSFYAVAMKEEGTEEREQSDYHH